MNIASISSDSTDSCLCIDQKSNEYTKTTVVDFISTF